MKNWSVSWPGCAIKFTSFFPDPYLHPSNKFCGNPSSSLCVILFTNRQTNAEETITSLAQVIIKIDLMDPTATFLMTLAACSRLWGPWGGEINKVYSSTGTGRGTRILGPAVQSLTSTSGPDGCSGQLLHSHTMTKAKTEPMQAAYTPFFCCVAKWWVSVCLQ